MNALKYLLITFFISINLFAQGQNAQDAKSSETNDEEFDVSGPLTLENSLKLRDPFAIFKDDVLLNPQFSSLPELERYPLDRFRLIGVIVGTKKNKAMLVSPDGKLHIVSENVKIGVRNGRIKSIMEGNVLVEEKVINILGKEEKIISKIELDNKDKGKSL